MPFGQLQVEDISYMRIAYEQQSISRVVGVPVPVELCSHMLAKHYSAVLQLNQGYHPRESHAPLPSIHNPNAHQHGCYCMGACECKCK